MTHLLAEDSLVGTGGGGLVGVGPIHGGLRLGGGPVGCGVGSFANGGGGVVGRSNPPFCKTSGCGGWKLSPGASAATAASAARGAGGKASSAGGKEKGLMHAIVRQPMEAPCPSFGINLRYSRDSGH